MTYNELLQKLYELSPEQLQMTVTAKNGEEFLPVKEVSIVYNSDVLDDNHPVLEVA